jgi:hypothetical protein
MSKAQAKSDAARLLELSDLIDQFAHGTEEKHYTTVAMVSRNFVIFKIKGHTAWACVGGREYVGTQHILVRRGDWWMANKTIKREWQGRVKTADLKEALKRSELTKEVYTGDLTAPMCGWDYD